MTTSLSTYGFFDSVNHMASQFNKRKLVDLTEWDPQMGRYALSYL